MNVSGQFFFIDTREIRNEFCIPTHTSGNLSDHRKLTKVKENCVNPSETQCYECYVSSIDEMVRIRD